MGQIIVLGMEETPPNFVSFLDMMIDDDGSLYNVDRPCTPHTDIAVLPYSRYSRTVYYAMIL